MQHLIALAALRLAGLFVSVRRPYCAGFVMSGVARFTAGLRIYDTELFDQNFPEFDRTGGLGLP